MVQSATLKFPLSTFMEPRKDGDMEQWRKWSARLIWDQEAAGSSPVCSTKSQSRDWRSGWAKAPHGATHGPRRLVYHLSCIDDGERPVTQRKDGSCAVAGTYGTAYGPLAQQAEQATYNCQVSGSNPGWTTSGGASPRLQSKICRTHNRGTAKAAQVQFLRECPRKRGQISKGGYSHGWAVQSEAWVT